MLEEGGEERAVLLLLVGQAAIGGGRVEPGVPRHLQRIQAPLQHLICSLMLPRRPVTRTKCKVRTVPHKSPLVQYFDCQEEMAASSGVY